MALEQEPWSHGAVSCISPLVRQSYAQALFSFHECGSILVDVPRGVKDFG